MDLNNISMTFSGEDSRIIGTSIGDLKILKFTIKSSSDLEKAIDGESEELTPLNYMRSFVRVVCYPIESLIDGNKPDYYPLSVDDVRKLSIDELNEIAGEFIRVNKYLYREKKRIENDEDDKVSVTYRPGKVLYSKKESESNVEYLYRLQVKQKGKRSKAADILRESVLNELKPSHFMSGNVFKDVNLSDSFNNGVYGVGTGMDKNMPSIGDIYANKLGFEKINPFQGVALTPEIELFKNEFDNYGVLNKPHSYLNIPYPLQDKINTIDTITSGVYNIIPPLGDVFNSNFDALKIPISQGVGDIFKNDLLKGHSHFSDILNKDIVNTLTLGESLTNTIQGVDPITLGVAGGVTKFGGDLGKDSNFENKIHEGFRKQPTRFNFNLPDRYDELFYESKKAEIEKEEKRLKPLNDMSESLAVLVEVSTKTAEFTVEMNKTQLKVADEIKSSGDESSKLAREGIDISKKSLELSDKGIKLSDKSVKLNYIVIGLTLLGVFVSFGGVAYSIYQSIESDEKSNSEMVVLSKGLNRFSQEFSELSKTLKSSVEQNNQQVIKEVELIKENSAIQEKYYDELLQKQRDESERLQKIIEIQEKKIVELERKISIAPKQKHLNN
ncbi:hypothetical protein [Photobacterium galatheae]|uniref:Uncharacterized protein n=1 Tax=Photobacterium galatheae TaxID=1654360 RepID=A0A066RUK8_9GAMM|nr:hypothetical protein [Photobacterium galatheae]KDM91387.1 hypothetical protein EA58_12570 [Photobacterium galatheae]MCM0151646.1 hypothetical protein [Photobacterium galatheae]